MHSILMIGCGGLGKCLLELNLICNFIPHYYKNRNMRDILIIEPLSLGDYDFYEKYNIRHIKISLTKNNIEKVLHKYVPNSVIVLDVSIGINAIDVIRICNLYNVMYVNTSLENWEIENPHILPQNKVELYPRTLHYQYSILMKEKNNIKPTMVFDHGMNPGMISHLAKYAISEAYKSKYKKKIPLTKKRLTKAAIELSLDTIHIAELDTQKLKKGYPFKTNTFYNTWSPMGMIAEGIDPIQIGHSRHGNNEIDRIINKKGYQIQNMKYFPVRGMSKKVKTITITKNNKEIITEGFLIPHGEANTLSKFLSSGDYTPNVYYVYRPSEPTLHSIENLKKRKYIHQPVMHPVLDQRQLSRSGYDSIGAFLILGEYNWWTGTVLSIGDVRKMGMKYAGPTEVQVAISYLACIKWMLNNTRKGVCSPEDLPSLDIIRWCKPYLGSFINRRVNKNINYR